MTFVLALAPAVFAAYLLPAMVFTLASILFLRANRHHRDYGWICSLTLIAALIWVAISLSYAGDAVVALQQELPRRLDSKLFEHPFSAWIMFCAPAFPAFAAILVISFQRRRHHQK